MRSPSIFKSLAVLPLALAGAAIACSTIGDVTLTYTLTLSSGPLPDAEVGQPYSFRLVATGASSGPYMFVVDEAPPAGLTVNRDGLVSGVPLAPGAGVVGVHFNDAGATGNGVAELPINVFARLVADPVILPQGPQNSPYLATVTSHGGGAPTAWTVKHGTLPAGLALRTDGVISGSPTAAGATTFELLVTDRLGVEDSLACSITIVPPAIGVTITSSALPNGEVSAVYGAALTAVNGTPPFTWSIASGTLPGGLQLSAAGVISGTPTASGPFPFVVRVTDAASGTDTRSLTLTIVPAVTISTIALPSAVQGQAYSFPLVAANGAAPYAWSVATGPLPTGLNLSSGGVISGTPTVATSWRFTVQVNDALGGSATQSLFMSVTPALIITTADPLVEGEVGVPYITTSLQAANGMTPYTWSVASGALANGLSMTVGGVISGTPTAVQTATFTANVNDAQNTNVRKSFTQVIHPAVAITTASPLPLGVDGQVYSTTLAATGGVGQYAWSITSGALPAGLHLDATGAISGTPTAGPGTGFTVQVADGIGGIAIKAFTIPVNPSTVTIAMTSPLPGGEIGLGYSVPFVATGGTTPYGWSVTAGTLPTNVAVFFGALYSVQIGAPAGIYTFDVQVKDKSLATATKTFTLEVRPQPSFLTASLPNGHVGVPYSQTLLGQNGFPPLGFLVDGSSHLPAGLSMSSSGVITGTPSTAQTVDVLAKVFDGLGGFSYQHFTMTIQP